MKTEGNHFNKRHLIFLCSIREIDLNNRIKLDMGLLIFFTVIELTCLMSHVTAILLLAKVK